MMLAEQQLPLGAAKLLAQIRLHPQTAPQPGGKGARELWQAEGELAQVADQDPLELTQRLLVEDDVIDLLDGHAGLRQAESRRLYRQRGIVLDAGEPLLLGRSDDLAVDDECGRRIVKERAYSENDHQYCLRALSSEARPFGRFQPARAGSARRCTTTNSGRTTR